MTDVLIVDDHTDIRRLLSVTLSSEFSVREAADGESALQLVRQLQPKVVLLDVMLPGAVDGFQVLRTIKSDPLTQTTIVAMVSARTQQVDQQCADQGGADAFFSKPFSPMQVKAWIRTRIQAL